MKDSRENVTREGFTIRPSRMALLRNLPQFSGKGTTEIMVELIEAAISGSNQASPFSEIGLVGVISDYAHHDYTEYLDSDGTLILCLRDYPAFRFKYDHWPSLAGRFHRNRDTFIKVPPPYNPVEESLLSELVEAAQGTEPQRLTHIATQPNFNLLPPFAIITDATYIWVPYTPFSTSSYALVFDAEKADHFMISEAIWNSDDESVLFSSGPQRHT